LIENFIPKIFALVTRALFFTAVNAELSSRHEEFLVKSCLGRHGKKQQLLGVLSSEELFDKTARPKAGAIYYAHRM